MQYHINRLLCIIKFIHICCEYSVEINETINYLMYTVISFVFIQQVFVEFIESL